MSEFDILPSLSFIKGTKEQAKRNTGTKPCIRNDLNRKEMELARISLALTRASEPKL